MFPTWYTWHSFGLWLLGLKHKELLTVSLPKRRPQGPFFYEFAGVVERWCHEKGRSVHSVPVPEVREYLDAAVNHVKEFGTSEDACNETQLEPLWLLAEHESTMNDLLQTYSLNDSTGNLNAIFGSLLC